MEKDLETTYPSLAKQWSKRNLPLTPQNISYGSNRLVWWNGECGHEWQASPHSRTGKKPAGCPYCSGNRVLPGFNDLASGFPEIAAQWSERNLPLRPEQVTAFSNRKVWWKGTCGHEWFALISSRSDGHGCPYCEDHKMLKGFNDFAAKYPKLAQEWSEKNKLKPDEVTVKKSGFFWWRCPDCGGEYRAWISSRIEGSRCPYCSGKMIDPLRNSLAALHPGIAAEWDYERNKAISPDQVSALSKKVYWWKGTCGHEWKARIYDRTERHERCYKCEQEFVSVLPGLLTALYAGRNGLKVIYDSDEITGICMEMYIPEFQLAIEALGNPDSLTREQKVKAHICAMHDIQYVLYHPFASAEDAAQFVRTCFQKNHVYIQSSASEDISLCREKYQVLKRRKTA